MRQSTARRFKPDAPAVQPDQLVPYLNLGLRLIGSAPNGIDLALKQQAGLAILELVSLAQTLTRELDQARGARADFPPSNLSTNQNQLLHSR